MTVICVSAFPHYFPHLPYLLHASILIPAPPVPHLAYSVTVSFLFVWERWLCFPLRVLLIPITP
jgi:hypothetical protein